MRKTKEELTRLDFNINSITSSAIKNPRLKAGKGSLKYLECTKCKYFYPKESFSKDRSSFIGRSYNCYHCVKEKNDRRISLKNSNDSESPKTKTKKQECFEVQNSKQINLTIKQIGEYWAIIFMVGSDYTWYYANSHKYINKIDARSNINEDLSDFISKNKIDDFKIVG